ncbi:MAG: trypsin-like peptidase domain-containing protein, partial [Clostridia bacterium]|nr:trypsin-like peptidase domain-containing protein [Clostridia bacterium]
TALWDRRYQTVRFDAGGGDFSDPGAALQRVGYGEMPVVPEVKRENYDFLGWDKEISPATEDVKYTALWQIIPLSEEEIYSAAVSATVEIRIYDKTDIELSFGSGFFISHDGDIATAAHVIEGASRIKVKLSDGRELTAREVVSCDFDTDIAVIKVSGKNLPAPIELSRNTADIGDTVYAIGSPGGRRGEMTAGEITRFSFVYDRTGLLVFSAPIEGGSSGGPLLDARGRAVGINIAVSALAEEYLAVRISELDNLTRENLSIEEYTAKYGNQGNAKPESEPNDNPDLAQKVKDGALVRGALSTDSDRDVYLCSDTANVLFVVAVKAEDSVKLIAEGRSTDESVKVKVRMIYGSNGDYAHVHVSVISASPADAYLTVRANGDKDIPVIYSVHTVEK